MTLSILQCAAGMPNWGGAELHLLTLSDHLRRRGHDVTVACWPGRWVERRAQEMGLAVVPVTLQNRQDTHDLGRLRRFLSDHRVDVLHAHSDNDLFVPPLAGIGAGVPVRVLTRHLPHPLRRRDAWVCSNLLFSRTVAVSESVRQGLIRSGMNPARVDTIHHGTDAEAFSRTTRTPAEVRAELGIPDGAVAVGILGRIALEKGHRTLLRAVRALADRYSLRCVIAGDGPDEGHLKKLAQEQGLGREVIFTGFREDVNNVMSALDIAVTASTWAEPCSAVVQQGMALSKPVIGTRVGGTPEMIVDGETGLLVPPDDVGALAGAIAALAADAALRRRMGAAGRARVAAHFSLHHMVDQVEGLYRREYQRARSPQALRKALAP